VQVVKVERLIATQRRAQKSLKTNYLPKFCHFSGEPPWNSNGADAGTRRLPQWHSPAPRLDSGAFGKVPGIMDTTLGSPAAAASFVLTGNHFRYGRGHGAAGGLGH